jgi:hypothetical protein
MGLCHHIINAIFAGLNMTDIYNKDGYKYGSIKQGNLLSTGFFPADYSNTTAMPYIYPHGTITSGTVAMVANTLYLVPYWIGVDQVYTKIGCEVTVGAGSTLVRMGVYTLTSNGMPFKLVLDAGTIDSSSSGIKIITISKRFFGKYWFGCISAGTPTVRGVSGGSAFRSSMLGCGTDLATSGPYAISQASASSFYTAFPDTYTGSSTLLNTGTIPLTFLQV